MVSVVVPRIGVFGGLFNPPHIGHLSLCQEAAWQLGLDRVVLVPTGRPSHRAAPHESPEMRLRLAQAAALGNPMGQIGIDAATLQATASFSTARTVAIGADGATIDTGSNTLVANGLWLAQGPLTKAGGGALALEDLAWLQNGVVADGTLKVDGSLAATSLLVDAGATLSGVGVVGAPTRGFSSMRLSLPWSSSVATAARR